MKINVRKTKIMCISRNRNNKLKIYVDNADNVFVNATVCMLLLCCIFTTVNELRMST